MQRPKEGNETSGRQSPGNPESADGDALAEILEPANESIAFALRCCDSVSAEREAKKLLAPINAFMDSTMIMVDDEDVRYARLNLLRRVGQVLLLIGDFTKLVIDG